MTRLAAPAPMLQLQLTDDLAESRRAALSTREYLAGCGWDEATVLDCELALVEACNNAIRYSVPQMSPRSISVEVECRAGEIEMRVTDHSLGFVWPSEVTLPGPESESGRGLYIIHAVMDHVEYRNGEAENTLVMRRGKR